MSRLGKKKKPVVSVSESPPKLVETPPPGTKKLPRASARRLEELTESLPNVNTREALEEMSRLDPVIWTMYYRRLRGNRMTFDMASLLTERALKAKKATCKQREYDQYVKMLHLRHRPFMLGPLRDDHPHKVYKKGRQVGISELSITETLHFLYANPGTKWIVTFPRDTQLKDFSNTRIAAALQETPRMRSLATGTNQVYLKQIGESYMVLRSAWESNLGEGVDADGVTLDEKDRMKQGVDIAFKESLSSSRFGYIREVSTPTLPGQGVDASWQISDQHQWFVKCERCSMKQSIDYPDNVIQVKHIKPGASELPDGAYEYLCRKEKCRGKLDRLHGEWVAKHPSIQKVRGYHMPQTIAVWISATELMQKKLKYKFQQLWINYVLGETSTGETILLTAQDFENADAKHPLIWKRTVDWPRIVVGIDWGHRNWVTVMAQNVNGRCYILNAAVFEDKHSEELHAVKAIESFIAPFAPDLIVADAGYGKDRNSYLLRKFGEGRVYGCHYNPASKGNRTFTPAWSPPEQARLTVDRTMTLKIMCRAIKDREFAFPNREHDMVQLLEQHVRALTPIKEEDEDGDIVEVIAASGDDHLAHSTAYAYLGMDRLNKTGRFNFDFMQ